MLLVLLFAVAFCSLPRNVRIQGRQFIDARTNETIVMKGPNIVVKGPPYIPDVAGNTTCNDTVNDECAKTGTCTSCTTFNEADVNHIKNMGWNMIRLGVVWAGAQPKDENALDPDFLERLHAILNLTDQTGIHVILDNHGDMVGSAGCGNGVPVWVQKKAAPQLIGKPLRSTFPYDIIPELRIEELNGYCGNNASKWSQFSGDPNYNLLNECCQQINGPNPPAIGYAEINQRTMDYLVKSGPGREAFVRFWRLMSEAVIGHPSAFAFELMNEPVTIRRKELFETWKDIAEAVNNIIPDLSVSITDTGEGPVLPWYVTDLIGAGIDIEEPTVEWIKHSNTLYYAWHYYGMPKDAGEAVENVQAISKDWNVPTFLTEFMSCSAWKAATKANISFSYWHYSSYCTTGRYFGNRKAPDETFGACILGWAGGDSSKTCI